MRTLDATEQGWDARMPGCVQYSIECSKCTRVVRAKWHVCLSFPALYHVRQIESPVPETIAALKQTREPPCTKYSQETQLEESSAPVTRNPWTARLTGPYFFSFLMANECVCYREINLSVSMIFSP